MVGNVWVRASEQDQEEVLLFSRKDSSYQYRLHV